MEGVETRRAAPKFLKKHGEGIVQTTKPLKGAAKAVDGKKILWPLGRVGSSPTPGTKLG